MISATRYRAQAAINRQSSLGQQIAKLEESVSSGKRIVRPSDDPTAATRVAEIRQAQSDQTVYTHNANTGISISSVADTKLASVATILDRAKDLVLKGRNDTSSAADRTSIANELRDMANDVVTLSQDNDPTGRPLFPTTEPTRIPVSDTLSIPATASRDAVFNKLTTAKGTQSISDILNDAADALEQTDETLRGPGIQTSIESISTASGHIISIQSDQGVRAKRFDDAKDQIASNGDALTEERSSLEDTDLTYALADFQAKQLALQAAQTVYAQGNKTSLFDLLG